MALQATARATTRRAEKQAQRVVLRNEATEQRDRTGGMPPAAPYVSLRPTPLRPWQPLEVRYALRARQVRQRAAVPVVSRPKHDRPQRPGPQALVAA